MPENVTSSGRRPPFDFVVALLLIAAGIVAILGFARFGNPRRMPDSLERLAIRLGNPRTLQSQITPSWAFLCRAWRSWLGNLRRNAPLLLQAEDLWEPNDPLRADVAGFLATANELRPAVLVPEAAAEKDLSVLAESPPEPVQSELLTNRIATKVEEASTRILTLAVKLERWRRWDEMRALLKLMEDRGFTRAAAALQPRLPPVPGGAGYRLNATHTLKLFNEIARDEASTLRLLSRWSEFTRLAVALQASRDPAQRAAPGRLLDRLTDQPTLAEFADSLSAPLEDLRRLSMSASVTDARLATPTQEPVQNLRPLAPVHRL